jgi:serine/threonine-protein kinase
MTVQPGTKLGRYEIRSKIGEGGMGEVYLAQDTKLDRKVALKILPADVAALPDRMRRFVQEVKTASALNHPNIITIHEIEHIDSVNFIATEFIDGETLRQRIKKKPMKLGEVLDLATQIAGALSAAHAAGIVHRDIKPENIMLRRDGIVKVLDFGLAKLTEQLPSDSVDTEAATKALVQTEPGVVLGTIAYMSPEQARGLAVDARTDIFSLGVVIYEMVAGQAPFGGATTSDLIVALLERDPPPLARFAPEAPAELERLVMKTLAKDSDERYQTAKDLLIDLKRLKQKLKFDAEVERSAPPEVKGTGGESKSPDGREFVPAAPGTAAQTAVEDVRATSSAEYIVGEIRRHKRTFTFLLVVMFAAILVGGLAIYWRTSVNNVPFDSIAVLPFVNQGGNVAVEYLSDGLTDSIISSLSQIPNFAVISRTSVFKYKGREIDPQAVGRELKVRAVLMGRIAQRGDDLVISVELVDTSNNHQLWGDQYNRKLADIVGVQQEIAKQISEKLQLKLSGEDKINLARRQTQNSEAYQLYLKGRYEWNRATEDGLKKSIEFFEQAISKDGNYALAYAGLADAYWLSTDIQFPPRESMPKAREAAQKALQLDDRLGEAHISLAVITYQYDWNWLGAEKEFRQAVELSPSDAEAHHQYGWFLAFTGKKAESIREFTLAQQLDPLGPFITVDLNVPYAWDKEYDLALDYVQRGIDLDPNFYGGPYVSGWIEMERGRYPEAIEKLRRARQLEDASWVVASLGCAYAASGNRVEAQKILDELTERSKHGYVSPYYFAQIYAGLGEKEKAIGSLEQAAEDRSIWMVWLKVERMFDNIRTDPRFVELRQRVGPPQ